MKTVDTKELEYLLHAWTRALLAGLLTEFNLETDPYGCLAQRLVELEIGDPQVRSTMEEFLAFYEREGIHPLAERTREGLSQLLGALSAKARTDEVVPSTLFGSELAPKIAKHVAWVHPPRQTERIVVIVDDLMLESSKREITHRIGNRLPRHLEFVRVVSNVWMIQEAPGRMTAKDWHEHLRKGLEFPCSDKLMVVLDGHGHATSGSPKLAGFLERTFRGRTEGRNGP